MDQIRTFVAIELPENIKQYLAGIENNLKSGCPSSLKWVNPGNIHLTLKFLGNIETKQIESILHSIKEAVQGFQPFILNITDLGVFPNLRNIQVVWVGLNGDTQILLDLQKKVESNLAPLGFPVEKRPFTAHLTLARVSFNTNISEKQTLSDAISGFKINTDFSFQAKEVSLMKSQLERTGAIYTRLHSIELKPFLS
jgi:RNA 2',3'-cyclic 3'-phosphodiesterase